jgi:hypothetical protein
MKTQLQNIFGQGNPMFKFTLVKETLCPITLFKVAII